MPAASGIRVDWERDGRLDLPEPLVKAVRDRKCMLFVGSGLSSMAGYPSWGELVDSLLQASKKIPYARTGGLEEYDRQKDYFTLAEFARSSLCASRVYDRLILRSPHVRTFLQAIFLNYSLLFVGYSLHDPDFQLVLRELTLIFENFIPAHYALISDAAEFTVEHLLTRMNIQTIPYRSADGHREVTQILERLQAEAPYSVAMPV